MPTTSTTGQVRHVAAAAIWAARATCCSRPPVTLEIAAWLGGGRTLLLLLLGVVAGFAVLRAEQFDRWVRLRSAIASGEMPLGRLLDGVLRVVAGFC